MKYLYVVYTCLHLIVLCICKILMRIDQHMPIDVLFDLMIQNNSHIVAVCCIVKWHESFRLIYCTIEPQIIFNDVCTTSTKSYIVCRTLIEIIQILILNT